MEEFILNKTQTRTSNNYGINEIKLKLDIPEIREFQNFTLISPEADKLIIASDETSQSKEGSNNEKMFSRIGLELKANHTTNITIPENTKINEPVILEFEFDDENRNLVDNVKITFKKNSEATIILKYKAEQNEEKYFHYLKNEVNLEENARGTIIISNLINMQSDSFIAMENSLEENSKLTSINIELGGKNRISNYYSKLIGDNSENNVKNIYVGTNKDVIDINYNIDELGKKAKCNIISEGAIDGYAKKHFKGIIDFKKGSIKSKGIENENCMILSENAESKSLPMLLCNEEDVYGEHGVSSGKPSESKIFYAMTKGISEKDAILLMVKANFNKIIRDVNDEETKNEIIEAIEQKLANN